MSMVTEDDKELPVHRVDGLQRNQFERKQVVTAVRENETELYCPPRWTF